MWLARGLSIHRSRCVDRPRTPPRHCPRLLRALGQWARVPRSEQDARDSVSADRLATFRCRQLYNSALAVDEDGRLAALYRKTHLFGSAEKAAFSPGERLGPIFELVGGVRCALLICYDIEFPEAGN